jgi:hypothetical protein
MEAIWAISIVEAFVCVVVLCFSYLLVALLDADRPAFACIPWRYVYAGVESCDVRRRQRVNLPLFLAWRQIQEL